MSKPFFYRINAADLLADAVDIEDDAERGRWILRLATDLVRADITKAKSSTAKAMIAETEIFRKKKAEAGRKGGSAKANSSSAKANSSSALAKSSIPLASSSSSSSSSSSTESKSKPAKKKDPFSPPTVAEVNDYCADRNNNVSPEKFFDFYESKGWMVGKNKMKDWKAAVRNWERGEKDRIIKRNEPSQTAKGLAVIEEMKRRARNGNMDSGGSIEWDHAPLRDEIEEPSFSRHNPEGD